MASPSFDAAVWETWPYLVSGASLALPPDQLKQAPWELRNWLLDWAITITFAATPLAEELLDLDWPSETPLRLLLTGADVLRRYPRPNLPFQLVNNYGPTEATVVATSGIVPVFTGQDSPPSIGRPIDGTRIRLLDGDGNDVEEGQAGELYIGGAGVARGYVNRPALTAERFVTLRGERHYRTGDLAWMDESGRLQFIGRHDDQVKVRGFRIELGEVTWALKQHPAVRACTLACTGDGANQNLVAYLVPREASDNLTTAGFRDFLAESLPDYMIPSVYVRLGELPLTFSGKVDRGRLPAPTPKNMIPATSEQASSCIIPQVARLVAGLLGVESIGSSENFFLLGGHSLFAAQLSARLRDCFGVEVPLRTVFDAPTVGGLAAAVDGLLIRAVAGMSDADAAQLLAQ
jgi:acyl-CoA synthetase (AMP-forming)/AMP-acid ligase II